MFAERKTQANQRADSWFDRLMRGRPVLFTTFLIVLAALVVLFLLYKSTATVVLYQGF